MRRLLLATIALLSAMVFVGCDVTVGMRDDLYALYYTSADGEVVYPTPEGFDGHILSNTYEKGRGKITFDRPITRVGDSAFRYCTSLTSITIPDSVTSIGGYAFSGCTSLTSVTIGNGVTSIGDRVFSYCTSLTSITIPDSVTSIGGSAFNGCTGELIINSKIVETDYSYGDFSPSSGWLKGAKFSKLTIGNGVTKIGSYAFKGCTSLTSITILDSVTSIGYCAFDGCTSLTSVYCIRSIPPSGGSRMFEFNASGRKIYVPTESVDAYKSADYWSAYADAIVGYSF